MPGPVPKRSDTRRRRNKPDGVQVEKAPAGNRIIWPEADPGWHPIAHRWFESIETSGQAQFYEQTDVETAYFVAEMMHRNLSEGRVNGQLFSSVMSAMADLLVTEGARRRARIELERNVPHAEVVQIKNYRAKAE
jgi:hypothetical protein